jgi:hypothetical protein
MVLGGLELQGDRPDHSRQVTATYSMCLGVVPDHQACPLEQQYCDTSRGSGEQLSIAVVVYTSEV